jgi:hypothetical protein
MRAAVSETVMSGSLPISSATIASTIWSELRRMFWADWRLRRRPVTTIDSSPSVGSAWASGSLGDSWPWGGSSCAAAGVEIKARTASEVDPRMADFRRIWPPLVARPLTGSSGAEAIGRQRG